VLVCDMVTLLYSIRSKIVIVIDFLSYIGFVQNISIFIPVEYQLNKHIELASILNKCVCDCIGLWTCECLIPD
jgi:hypothetical protein